MCLGLSADCRTLVKLLYPYISINLNLSPENILYLSIETEMFLKEKLITDISDKSLPLIPLGYFLDLDD